MAAYTTIDNPELHFQVKLYAGNVTDDTSITLDGEEDMAPDMIWFNCRAAGEARVIHDSPRGVHERIFPGTNEVEGTATDALQSFDSNGWTMGVNGQLNNNSGRLYVAWCWKANGSGSSDTNGTINSTATSANTTAGFSIVTYNGNATDEATVGHGIGTVPKFVLAKSTGNTEHWTAWHHKMTSIEYYLVLSTTGAQVDADGAIFHALPTSTLFSLGSDSRNNASGVDSVWYGWSEVQGYSKFGQYEGNGNADGTFVYTGFRPAWIMTKSIDSTSEWLIFDDQREGYNVDNDALTPEGAAELTTDMVDIVSNGFKCKIATDPNVAETYVYAAFAKAPLVNSEGVPCNAR